MGAGWIISRESNGKYLPGMKRLLLNGKPSSSVAEIYAVVSALAKIEHNSTVIVHADDLFLCRRLNDHNFSSGPSTPKSLQTALSALFEAVSTHKSVTAVHEKQEDSPHITRAHHLSRAACWLRGKDRLVTGGQ